MKLHITRSLLATRYSLPPKADPPMEKSSNKGQSLAEILIAISIAAIIVGSAAGALIFSVRSNQLNRANQGASPLAQELLDNVKSKAEGKWRDIYDLAEGSTCPTYCHHFDASLNVVAGSGGEQKVVNNITYTRYFNVENVNRNKCGTGEIVSTVGTLCSSNQTGVMDDPSTQKITAKVTWLQGSDVSEVSVVEYITRSKNDVSQFSDWSGVSGVAGPVIKPAKDYFARGGLENPVTTPGSLKLLLPPTGGWLISSTFDTGYTNGVVYNSIMWKGDLGLGTNSAVKFQLGSSNCQNGATNNPLCTIDLWSDPLSYKGPDGSSSSYYVTTALDAPVQIVTAQHNNKQYYRYKIYLESDNISPIVNDVIVNWSP